MNRVSTENLLADPDVSKPKKIRNYSFRNSRRLSFDKMTEVNGVKIPSMPGSCYHAIIAALAECKDQFCSWEKLFDLTHKNMRMFGGEKAWDKFVNKSNVKSFKQRIKDNTHTLTRAGRDCYGYRLHEQGMAIYFFKDGAMLVTGGELQETDDGYNVIFADGKRLQTRYRGTTMTYKEYKKFLSKGLIDNSGKILDIEGIKKLRGISSDSEEPVNEEGLAHVCVILSEDYNQDTAIRLEKAGLVVEQAFENEVIGTIPHCHLAILQNDNDVIDVEISGQ